MYNSRVAERYIPSKEIDPEEFQKFESLMNNWYMKTAFLSWGHERDDSALPILKSGKAVIPLMLASLAQEKADSHEAGVKAILVNSVLRWVATPSVPFEHKQIGGMVAAKVTDMRIGWLDWGVEKGLLVKEEAPENS